MDLISIKLENISRNFKVYNVERRIFKKILINKILKKKERKQLDEIFALKNINFELNIGERLGVVGRNGSGKTTLLRVLSGIYEPTSGNIEVNGKIKNVLEVGASGQLDDTVENNILLLGLLYGHNKNDILKKKTILLNLVV